MNRGDGTSRSSRTCYFSRAYSNEPKHSEPKDGRELVRGRRVKRHGILGCFVGQLMQACRRM